MEPNSSKPSSSRRDFLRRASAASTVAAALTPALSARPIKPSVSARSASRVIGANDRINIGMIGVGGNGFGNLRSFVAQSEEKKDMQIVAVSDVYTVRKERARSTARLEQKDVHHDYRDLLAKPDVDGVFIATPDHWHAQMAIDAMAAGKDVYLQKPMTYTIDEARQVTEAAARYKRVLQVGSQHLSDPRWQKAREVIAAGEIGELLWAQTTYSRYSRDGEWNYYVDEEGTPENIDWTRWLGTAPKRPFSAERYFRWRKYWDYSGGIATDLFYHRLGPMLFAMGAQFPARVSSSGGIYVQKDREVPDTYSTTVEFPNFYITLSSSMGNAAGNKFFPETIYGHKGTIAFTDTGFTVLPEGAPKGAKGKEISAEPALPINRLHTDNYLECMRNRQQTALNPDLGYKIMVAIRLGVDSYREGKVKFFDAVTQKVTDRGAARASYEGDGKNPPDSKYKKRA
jgi:predicted dehydrogenase